MSDGDTMVTSSPSQPKFTARAAEDPTYHVDPGKGGVRFAGVKLAFNDDGRDRRTLA